MACGVVRSAGGKGLIWVTGRHQAVYLGGQTGEKKPRSLLYVVRFVGSGMVSADGLEPPTYAL